MIPFGPLVMAVVCASIPLSLAQVTQTSTQASTVREFTLTASTDHLVHGVTQNFSLQCAFNTDLPASQSAFSEISRIRILKAEDNDQWKLIAEIRDVEVGVHLYDNILGNGQIVHDIRASYLKIIWPTVTTTTFGKYRCDVPGFDKNLDYAVEKSNIVILTEHNVTAQDVLNLLLDEQNRFQHELNADIKLVDANIQKLNQSVGNSVKTIDEHVNNLQHQLNTLNQSVGYNYQPWPEGTFSLLAPVTGCPRTSDWRKGYFKIHTESDNVTHLDQFNRTTFLPPYTRYSDGGQNFMILTYCSKITSTPGISWPRGSYCINQRASCPHNFSNGYVYLDEERTNRRSKLGGYFPYGGSNVQYFCCRSDGPATTDIQLPTADPFFLYRYNGTCQSVHNMQVYTESIIINTEKSSTNSDRYSNEYHPDGSLNPVVLHLCFYKPRGY